MFEKQNITHKFCSKEKIDTFSLHLNRCEAEFYVVWCLRVSVVTMVSEDLAAALGIDTFTHCYLLLSLLQILEQTNFIVIKIIIGSIF